MPTRLTQEYYVLREGEIQEEPVSRQELEALCRSGALSAECKIFDPEQGVWQRLGETEFVYILDEAREGVAEEAPVEAARNDGLVEAYQRACERVREAPSDWKTHFGAAEIAASLENVERARRHFSDALALSPYNPRVAAAVKKVFPPSEWKGFRRLHRVASVWDDVMEIVLYPIERGPLRVLVPGGILGLLTVWPAGAWAASVLAFGWAVLAAHAAAWGQSPSDWRSLPRTLRGGGGSALLATTVAAVEVCVPFFIVAQIGAWLDPQLAASQAFRYLSSSPILTVFMATTALLYLPGAVICASLPSHRFNRVTNPVRVVNAIRVMEVEYVMAAGFVAGWFCLWTVLRMTLGEIPLVGTIITGVTGAYGLLAGMFVLGRMTVRHQEEIETMEGGLPAEAVAENPLDAE